MIGSKGFVNVQPQVQEHFIKGVKGYYMFFKSEESRDTVIFFNGGFQKMLSWRNLGEFLIVDFDILFMDIPGTGDADAIDIKNHFDFQSEFVNSLLNKLKIEKVNIVSASYGSPIALRFTQLFEHRVVRLAMGSIMKEIPKYSKNLIKETISALEKNDISLFTDKVCQALLNYKDSNKISKFKVAERILRISVKKMSEAQRKMYLSTSKTLLSTALDDSFDIDCPVLVFTGEYDSLTSPSDTLSFAKCFKNYHFRTIRQADHFFHFNNFEATSNLIRSFFLKQDLKKVRGVGELVSKI